MIMSTSDITFEAKPEIDRSLSAEALSELEAMGLLSSGKRMEGIEPVLGQPRVQRRPIEAPEVLNEAYDYSLPSSFTRGLSIQLYGARLLLISGTASVDEDGSTIHTGDFKAQCLRTYRNITALLAAEGASWHDVIRTTCYLRDIERDYDAFNETRTLFFEAVGLDPLPASTGIQARLCRSDLLVEIEAMALVPEPPQ
jgi:enamine deaminase RidA (YjgF/YER057c/UK114 family)